MISQPETGHTKKDSMLLNTQFRESNYEGEGEVAKETAQPALR